MKKERLHISKATPGMILSAPVVSPNKITLFQIGTVLTISKINAIRKYNVNYIAIYDDIQSALDDNIITIDQVEEIKSIKESHKKSRMTKAESEEDSDKGKNKDSQNVKKEDVTTKKQESEQEKIRTKKQESEQEKIETQEKITRKRTVSEQTKVTTQQEAIIQSIIQENITKQTSVVTQAKIKIQEELHSKELSQERTIESVASEYYTNRIVNSEEFIEFAKTFNTNLEAFHTELHEIAATSKKVDVDELMGTTSDLLKLASNSLQVFDILHNLRHYDDSTYAHSLNVSIICNVFGKWLKFSDEDLKLLTVAGLLHDIGKLSIDPNIIKKPGKLTDEEFEAIKQHPVLGFNLLQKKGVDSKVLSAVLLHHKKCDGSGYPNLPESVPLTDFAKIVTIADIYEAMTANRVYRQGLCPFDVIRMLQDGGYQLYEPKFLMIFLNGIVQSYLNHYVQLSDGQVGVIKYINQFSPPDPMIQLESGKIVDLSKDKSVRIIALM